MNLCSIITKQRQCNFLRPLGYKRFEFFAFNDSRMKEHCSTTKTKCNKRNPKAIE